MAWVPLAAEALAWLACVLELLELLELLEEGGGVRIFTCTRHSSLLENGATTMVTIPKAPLIVSTS